MKGQRHLRIRELVKEKEIETQEELVAVLKEMGFNITQATISRDIKELQLIKVPTASGKYIYNLPSDIPYNPQQKLVRILSENYIAMNRADNLVVMKTLPGHANAIGALIDGLNWKEIIGTICGDDTILIVCKTGEEGQAVENRFLEML